MLEKKQSRPGQRVRKEEVDSSKHKRSKSFESKGYCDVKSCQAFFELRKGAFFLLKYFQFLKIQKV